MISRSSETREAGTEWGIRFVLGLSHALGRRVAQRFLRILAFFYALTRSKERLASQRYFQRLGLAHGFGVYYRHLLLFAECTLDRALLLSGRSRDLHMEAHGLEHLQALKRERRGAVLLGAHLGSFEALRVHGALSGLAITVVADFEVAPRIKRVLEGLEPDSALRVVSAASDPAALALQLGEAIERGELVAILADRAARDASVEVNFFGERARFPTGPHALAMALGCATYLTVCLYTSPQRYDFYCEPLASAERVPRHERARVLPARAQQFADRLAHYCRMAPYNWFNFHDFWA